MGFIDSPGGFAMDSLFDAAGDFSEGVAPVARIGRDRGDAAWHYVDATGSRALPGEWAWAGSFRGSRALVRGHGGSFHLIDRAGAVIGRIPDSARPMEERRGGVVTYVLPKPAEARGGHREDSSR